MKRLIALLLLLLLLTGCGVKPTDPDAPPAPLGDAPAAAAPVRIAAAPEADTVIQLSDDGITANGKAVPEFNLNGIYTAHDIVYYPTGQDSSFGEGTEADAHDPAEAEAHTVLHITEPGVYAISGKLSAGQIAVDLGKGAKKDPTAVVTLLLDNADITCTVAPAVIFYNVYECGSKDEEDARSEVDTSAAGANIFLANGSVNRISGSYVAKIYKPESIELNKDGTEVKDAKKLHKYDAALYSKMSMNIDGNDGILNILAENEGLGTELHLTVNGGDIRIESGNDGINTNEDGVSVTTINGGRLTICVNGSTGEGDGIDSNGWLVINGGHVAAYACGFSMDSGIDSDMGIQLNGGSVITTGNMLDEIGSSRIPYAVFSFREKQVGGAAYLLQRSDGEAMMEATPANDFSILILASDVLTEDNYSLLCGDTALSVSAAQGGMGNPGGMKPPEGFTPPDGMEMPEGFVPPQGMGPQGGMMPPQGTPSPGIPGQTGTPEGASSTFSLTFGGAYFTVF